MKYLVALILVVIALVAGAGVFAWSGVYDIGADAPHWNLTSHYLAALRDRSVRARSAQIALPNLDDPQRILRGAGHYAAMCTGCHLAPGMATSEIRPGLYPQPPVLWQTRVDPRDAFWVIKHGVKMSAMPAWGGSHDDATIWDMVAFVQKLPGMTAQQYKDIVAKAPPDVDMDMDHDHGDTTHAGHGMTGKPMPAQDVQQER